MDPMTQSAQISSSQGFADGQNSATKESKMSDCFLSSSPVSLIQSPQDKRVVLGSDKPCEGVATSLRFPSQPGSFSPGTYGSEAGPPDGQPDSPIKTSPVSERIKALEALAAKKKEPDFRSDGSFSHYRDRHHEKSEKTLTETPKSPTEKFTPTVQKRGGSSDLESPESPFEVLGDPRQVSEFEETEEWMKTHVPPVPDLGTVDLMKGTSDNTSSKEEKVTDIVIPEAPAAFAGVPEAFKDSPVEASKPKDDSDNTQKQPSVEEESEFDLSFLPTAYMWDQQEKSTAQAPSKASPVLPDSPAPPAGFGTQTPPASPPQATDSKQKTLDEKKLNATGDPEPPEAGEADSSGESDDTVIEDGVAVSSASSEPATATNPSTEDKETPPLRSERKLMQVPTINVIETDDPNYSDDEMEFGAEEEDYEVVKDSERVASKTPEPEEDIKETPKKRPLETEFMEGYSPPSSPVDSDEEYSPEHKIPRSLPDTVQQESAPKPEALSDQTGLRELEPESEKSQTTSSKVNPEPYAFMGSNDDVDFPDNDDEWSDEAQDMLSSAKADEVLAELNPYAQVGSKSSTTEKTDYMETASFPKTSFMQDDIYDRQSFDYDYDASCPMDDFVDKGFNNAKERFLSDSSQINTDKLNTTVLKDDDDILTKQVERDYPEDPYSSFQSATIKEQEFNKKANTDTADSTSLPKSDAEDTKTGHHAPDKTSDPDSSEPSDSFVDFMRECLKSRQDGEPEDASSDVPTKNKSGDSDVPSQQTPSAVMDLEQEKLTISALKELGSSQEEEVTTPPGRDNLNAPSSQPTSLTSTPNPPCSQSRRLSDSTYSKEVEAIDEWVAEAYHLAEHVLTAILTYISVKDLIHWRDPKKSGLVFGVSMLLLLSLAAFSVISVVSYLLLALLCVTITFRIYKSVVQAVQKSSEGHPFKALIDEDVSIPPETFRKHVDCSLTYINRALKQMSRLFLVEDLVDSLKLAVVMWLLTYVGAVFNGITILILADILLFAIPPIYEKNKTQIDQYIDLVRTQVNTTMAKLQEKLPGAVKRSKAE
ncbi:reticulon-3 isoform X1 [Halichoeres trimaculatus]|uniref:reticulon-3 isoform X1 n=1 Tax=Halichoeres trimaculatus TaxID=147232 RepID=UPI003D9E4DB3